MPATSNHLRTLALLGALSSTTACLDLDGDDGPSLADSEQAVLATGPAGTIQLRPIARGSWWSYDDRGVDLGTAWRTGTDAWATGFGPLGYGESYLATTVSFGTNSSNKHRTTYFRRGFGIHDVAKVRKLYLRVMYDDGFVFYINGQEGGRAGMPAGTVTYSTLALGHEAENRYVTFDISNQIPNLVAGGNQLAVEVHQQSASSSDLVFDAELIAWVDPPYDVGAAQGIERGSYWAVWDRGGDLGTAWREPGFDASSWSKAIAPVGFGEEYIIGDVTPGPITTYLRHTFRNDGSVTGLVGEVRYDDGIVVYLNGHEVQRRAMPSGALTAATLGFDHEARAYEPLDWSHAMQWLVPGENVLAVEVHQASTTSSDLVFDLELRIAGGWARQVSGTTVALQAVAFADDQRGWAVGDDSTILRTTDGGATWSSQPSGTLHDLRDIQLVDATHGYISGTAGTLLATTDGGATWQPRPTGFTADVTDLQFLDADRGFLLAGNIIYYTTDGGMTWTSRPLVDGNFYGMRFTDEQHGWVTGMVPVPGDTWAAVYRTEDGGVTWTQQWISGLHFFYLWGLELVGGDPATVWAYGQSSLSGVGEHKLYTHDTGATWELAPATANGSAVYDLQFVDAQRAWAVGLYGGIIHSDDGGASWHVQRVTEGDQPHLRGVFFVDARHGWAVGGRGEIWHTSNGGGSAVP